MRARPTTFATALLAAALLSAAAPPAEPGPASAAVGTQDLRPGILAKLEYDRDYFRRVLELSRQGRSDVKLKKADWENEVRRARANLPVLEQIFQERARYEAGEPLTAPSDSEVHRVYANLVGLLNMVQAMERKDAAGAAALGEKIVVRDRRDLGLVRSEDSRYYLNLYREYFYLMATAHYRLGHDSDAVAWLSKVESDADVQALKQKLAAETEQRRDVRAERLTALRPRPVAVVALTPLEGSQAQDAWLGAGLAEVFANDLVQETDLVVVERAHIAKIVKEAELSFAGFTEPRRATEMGELLNAGSLVVGTFRSEKGKVLVSLRLLDATDGQALAAAGGEAELDEIFPQARKVLGKLLSDAGWADEEALERLEAAHAPKADTVRALTEARLLLAKDSKQAKAAFEKAMKDDPAYAKAFADLRSQFSDVSSTLAVMPFVNTSGVDDDRWMAQGAVEALTTDLPRLGFRVVERSQLVALLAHRQAAGQVLDPAVAREAGQSLGADFVVLGSVLRQAARVRVDARFVDAGSGVVLAAVSAEGRSDAYPRVLLDLSTQVARRFNEKVSDELLTQLTGKHMGAAEFERYARERLAKEALERAAVPPPPAPAPKRTGFWTAVGGAAAGTALATFGYLLAAQSHDSGGYNEALLLYASKADDAKRLDEGRKGSYRDATAFTVIGSVGVAATVASAAYLVYRELAGQPPPPVQPVVAPAGGAKAVQVGVSARF